MTDFFSVDGGEDFVIEFVLGGDGVIEFILIFDELLIGDVDCGKD